MTPTDLYQIPNGELAAVKGSPFDFTTPHTIGERIGAVGSLTSVSQCISRPVVQPCAACSGVVQMAGTGVELSRHYIVYSLMT